MNDTDLLNIDVILAVINNDENALIKFYKHYDSWIRTICTSRRYDYSGNAFYYFDEEEYQEIIDCLCFSVKKFKIRK